MIGKKCVVFQILLSVFRMMTLKWKHANKTETTNEQK